MTTQYQIITIGTHNPLIADVLEVFYRHLDELGIERKAVIEINNANFRKDYKANAPTFCLYFGSSAGNFIDLDLVSILLNDATLILPIVDDLTTFNTSMTEELRGINGFQLASKEDIERLVGLILEGLSLLRLSRRLFISYKRDESSATAIQLYEQLEKVNYDVFLDTHSIKPGEKFQEELWHRLADTDVVVLLNTPGFLKSNWTTQELAQANSMSIGILQLIWPTHTLERDAELSIPFQLSESDFGNNTYNNSKSYLVEDTIKKITALVESLRARSLAARQDNIVTEFIAAAIKLGKTINLQPEKFIVVKRSDDNELVVIPTVGVPQAFTYNQSEELVKRIKTKAVKDVFILYDHRNIRENWLEHLAWLDQYLPVKAIKITEVEKWLTSI
jgi:hypothetical protein